MSFVDQFLLKLRVQKLPPVSVVPGNPARVIVKDTLPSPDQFLQVLFKTVL